MEKKSYTVAVDLGSSQVVVVVGSKQPDGTMEIASLVSRPVEGVNAGRIENIELVSRAIKEAVAAVEEELGIRISEAYAGISGDFVRCARHTDHVFASDAQNGINQRDVDALFDRMRNVQAPDDETIMERVPQYYKIDDQREVEDPVGTFGRKLSSTFNFVLCQKVPMQRLDMALKRLGIKMLGVFTNVMATPEAVLSPDEKEEGVALVDVGAGVTDVTLCYRDVVRYVASIPMGASAINRDIRSQSIPEKHIESLKLKYGSAVAELAPEDKQIQVKGRVARESKVILLRNLATVIEARATDIIDFVKQEIRDSGYEEKLTYGIVLTGGSAKLKDFDELFRRVTGMEVRVGSAEFGLDDASKEKYADPAYATAIGLLLRGAAQGACAVAERPRPVAPAVQPNPVPPRPAFVPPAPEPRPEPRHIPPKPQPAPQPAPQPEPRPEPAADTQPAAPAHEPEVQEPRKRRDWGKFFQSAFKKINDGFSAGEDEEI